MCVCVCMHVGEYRHTLTPPPPPTSKACWIDQILRTAISWKKSMYTPLVSNTTEADYDSSFLCCASQLMPKCWQVTWCFTPSHPLRSYRGDVGRKHALQTFLLVPEFIPVATVMESCLPVSDFGVRDWDWRLLHVILQFLLLLTTPLLVNLLTVFSL